MATLEKLDAQHWSSFVATVSSILVSIIAATIGATWMLSASIHSATDSFLAIQAQNEKRITTLEVQQQIISTSVSQLTQESEKNRDTEGDLLLSVQKLNDLIERRR